MCMNFLKQSLNETMKNFLNSLLWRVSCPFQGLPSQQLSSVQMLMPGLCCLEQCYLRTAQSEPSVLNLHPITNRTTMMFI